MKFRLGWARLGQASRSLPENEIRLMHGDELLRNNTVSYNTTDTPRTVNNREFQNHSSTKPHHKQ